MIKSTHIAFPPEGVELRISADDALAQGIKPGDPAVVEVIVRAHTVPEWVAEATDHAAHVEDGATAPVAAEPVDSGPAGPPTTIRWRSAVAG
jgi:hypothetical protein